MLTQHWIGREDGPLDSTLQPKLELSCESLLLKCRIIHKKQKVKYLSTLRLSLPLSAS